MGGEGQAEGRWSKWLSEDISDSWMWWLSQYCRKIHVDVSDQKNSFWKGCGDPTHACIVEKGLFSTFPFHSEGIFTWLLMWTLAQEVCQLLLTTGALCHSSVKKSESKSAKTDKPGSLRGGPTRRPVVFILHGWLRLRLFVC